MRTSQGGVWGLFCDLARQQSKSSMDFLKHIGHIQQSLGLLDPFSL
jgi:hypothetical protein